MLLGVDVVSTETADEALGLNFLEQLLSFVPEFSKGVQDDAEDDLEEKDVEDDEEGNVEEVPAPVKRRAFSGVWHVKERLSESSSVAEAVVDGGGDCQYEVVGIDSLVFILAFFGDVVSGSEEWLEVVEGEDGVEEEADQPEEGELDEVEVVEGDGLDDVLEVFGALDDVEEEDGVDVVVVEGVESEDGENEVVEVVEVEDDEEGVLDELEGLPVVLEGLGREDLEDGAPELVVVVLEDVDVEPGFSLEVRDLL